jgi:hypothetical protein
MADVIIFALLALFTILCTIASYKMQSKTFTLLAAFFLFVMAMMTEGQGLTWQASPTTYNYSTVTWQEYQTSCFVNATNLSLSLPSAGTAFGEKWL